MMSYFGLREWHFRNENIDQLAELLKSQKNHLSMDEFKTPSNRCDDATKPNVQSDGKTVDLEFDMRTIDWNEYFYHYLPGIKKYFFKERLTNKCSKHYKRYVTMVNIAEITFNYNLNFIYSIRLRFIHIFFKSTFIILCIYLSSSVVWKFILKLIMC